MVHALSQTLAGTRYHRVMSDAKPIDVALLRRFSPFDGMKKDNVDSLARKTTVKQLAASRVLFKEGDREKRSFWLVSGMLELREGERTVGMIRAGTPEARSPISPQLPRKVSARAVDPVEYLSLDSELLDMMITWDQTGSYEVAELQSLGNADDEDWMTTLLQTQAFQRIPPANIQAIFMRMQRMNTRAGEVIIQQGTEGDFFYA